jgi:hypothetical protein
MAARVWGFSNQAMNWQSDMPCSLAKSSGEEVPVTKASTRAASIGDRGWAICRAIYPRARADRVLRKILSRGRG